MAERAGAEAVAAIPALGKSNPGDIIDDLTDFIDIDASIPDGISRNYVDRVPFVPEIPVSSYDFRQRCGSGTTAEVESRTRDAKWHHRTLSQIFKS